MIFGIVSVLGGILLLIPAVLAIVFGHVSLSRCRRDNIKAGRNMSIAGLVMGYASVVSIPVIGLMAAMAIPAFQKVRAVAQEKAMINNLRVLSSAADRYYLENNASTVAYSDLVGPGKYVSRIQPVAGEKYPDSFRQHAPVQVIKSDGTVLMYDSDSGRLTRIRDGFEYSTSELKGNPAVEPSRP